MHRARQVTSDDYKQFDFILCMDQSNLRDLQDMAPSGATAAVKLLGSFDPHGQTIIKDPYYGGLEVCCVGDILLVTPQSLICCSQIGI
jgi:low molecular weight phosphotyrosine protein phosphatase